MMKESQVEFVGRHRVVVTLFCRDVAAALSVYGYADANPPEGYFTKTCRISQRGIRAKTGRHRAGRERICKLAFDLVSPHAEPMIDWRDWDATLEEEQRLATGPPIVRPPAHGSSW